jgi:hypothetical protein
LDKLSYELLHISLDPMPDPGTPNVCSLPVSEVICITFPDGEEIGFTLVIAIELADDSSLAE